MKKYIQPDMEVSVFDFEDIMAESSLGSNAKPADLSKAKTNLEEKGYTVVEW